MGEGRIQNAEMQGQADRLLQVYRECFVERFGSQPVLDVNESMGVLRWAVAQMTYERSLELIKTYFQLQNEWVETKAFPLPWWRQNINEVIAGCAGKRKITRQVWVIGRTLDGGLPVCSYNKDEMKDFNVNGSSIADGTVFHFSVQTFEEYPKELEYAFV